MEVTFVCLDQLDVDPSWKGHYHYGVGVLSSTLKQAGISTSLIHVTSPHYGEKEFVPLLQQKKPDLLCFSSTTLTFSLATELMRATKAVMPDLKIVVGGLHATLAPEEVIALDVVDVLCRGEGEEALLELCRHLTDGSDFTGVRNLWVRANGQVYRNPMRPLRPDLDFYPLPDREIFDFKNLYHERKGWGTFMFTRGCAYDCTYCANSTLKGLYGNPQGYVRFRCVDKVIEEIRDVVQKYPFIKYIHFDDDLPFIRDAYTQEFCEKYKKEIGLPFRFNLRPNLADEDTLRMLKDAGCIEVKIGIESGNDHIINNVLRRNLSVQQIEEAFQAVHGAGLLAHSFCMVGLPEETPATILDTIKLNARTHPSIMQVSVFFPFPGTPLREFCEKRGWISGDAKETDYYSQWVLKMPTLSKRQVFFYRNTFWQLVRLYELAYKFGTSKNNVLVRFLDRSLSFEPTRRLWAIALAVTLPTYRYLRDWVRPGGRY